MRFERIQKVPIDCKAGVNNARGIMIISIITKRLTRKEKEKYREIEHPQYLNDINLLKES